MDPFLDLIRLLQPKCTLWGKTVAAGRWGLGFRERHDLLFCWIQEGSCLLTRPGHDPVELERDDFLLIRTVTPFALTTDPTLEPQDSEALSRMDKGHVGNHLGSGSDNPVAIRGGRFVFSSANQDLLTGLIPPLVHIGAAENVSWRIRSLLNLNEAEVARPGLASSFLVVRLMEMILVEILRGQKLDTLPENGNLLSGLADTVTCKAITAMHADVSKAWTLVSLAKFCGTSRSALAARFQQTVGIGPIEYLQRWRMALAKSYLQSGRAVGEIAFLVGFQSSSAFTTAFTRVVGCPPTTFAARFARGNAPQQRSPESLDA